MLTSFVVLAKYLIKSKLKYILWVLFGIGSLRQFQIVSTIYVMMNKH